VTNIAEAFAQAVSFHQAGRLVEAEGVYRKILAADPENVPAMNNLGLITAHDESVALFRRAVALNPTYADAFVNLGNVLKSDGQLDDAIALYERAVAIKPEFVTALYNLANARLAKGQLDDAIAWYKRVLVACPDHVDALIQVATALQAQNKLDEAFGHLERAAGLRPDSPDIHFSLGSIRQSQQRHDDAVVHYERAIALKPDYVAALHNLGTVHAMERRYNAATKWYRWALALDPTLQGANTNMVTILESAGRLAEAKIFRDRVQRPMALVYETSPQPQRTVLVPSAMGPGNVPIERLFPRDKTTRIRWYVDYSTDAFDASLPACDLVFNGIGNADLTGESYERLSRFHARRPMLNAPEKVEPTRRDRLPDLLAGIPNLVVPRVVRLRRDEVVAPGLAARLAKHGLECPVLVRPIGTHGGGGLILIETAEQLAKTEFDDADMFYFIAYYDYKLTDGLFRKFRTIYVDRKAYPYHLAISDKWLVHYFSANMLSAPWKREEEHRFLADPVAALGRPAAEAVEAIGRRMDLDYAGIDFSLMPDGRVLVFEANATMAVHLYDSPTDFPYKHQYVPAIFNAFEAMLQKHEKKGGR
jgi:tetratricopeptide (TPR) repeat protein